MSDPMMALDRYAAAWEALRPDDISPLDPVLAPTCRFVDPFSDVSGREAVLAALAHGYRRFREVRVTVHDRAMGRQAGYLRWTYAFTTSRGRQFAIEGMSEIVFDGEGRATLHRDHWDAAGQVYERVSLLGPILRFARRRV